jgi:hypothetical protein
VKRADGCRDGGKNLFGVELKGSKLVSLPDNTEPHPRHASPTVGRYLGLSTLDRKVGEVFGSAKASRDNKGIVSGHVQRLERFDVAYKKKDGRARSGHFGVAADGGNGRTPCLLTTSNARRFHEDVARLFHFFTSEVVDHMHLRLVGRVDL